MIVIHVLCKCVLMVVIGFLANLSLATIALAVDKSRMWLPGKYSELMPKLIEVAEQAEKMRRCQWVINGQINVSKSTEENHYFVITCRDEQNISYNLGYLYPVNGHEAVLIAEQGGRRGSSEKRTQVMATGEKSSIDEQEVLEICDQAVAVELEAMPDAALSKPEVTIADENERSYQYPLTVRNVIGTDIRYRADCTVDANANATVSISLDKIGALAICKDTLRFEALRLKKLKVIAEETLAVVENEEGFFYQLPFMAVMPGGTEARYSAECQVDRDGVGDVIFGVDKTVVVPLCVNQLKAQTHAMINVSLLDESQVAVVEYQEGYKASIAFNANSPEGRILRFQAMCEVSRIGMTSVAISPRAN